MNAFEQKITTVYGNKGKRWIAELPNLVTSIVKNWGLTDLKVVDNLSYNYILSGFQKGKPIILKVGINKDELAREVAALQAFAGFGAIEVLHVIDNAILLEHAISGASLKNYSTTDNRAYIKICCDVMKRLHQAPMHAMYMNQFPHMHDWLTIIDKDWEIPKHYLIKARELKKQLLTTEITPILLHGDLHWENILLNGNDWVVIDPKGVIGNPINEVWAFIMDVEKDTQYVAQAFNYELKFVLYWYFVHLIMSACWNLEDNLSPDLHLELAKKTYAMI